jgi:hypothetical protein
VAVAAIRMDYFRSVVARLRCVLARVVVKGPADVVVHLVNRGNEILEHQEGRYPVGPGGLCYFGRAPDRGLNNLAPSLDGRSACTRLPRQRRAMENLAGYKSPVPANLGQWIVAAARVPAGDAVVGQY